MIERRSAPLDAPERAHRSRRLTVDPSRELATPFGELARREGGGPALREGLSRLEAAIDEHFPDNLFWDYDALVAALVQEASSEAALLAAFDDVVALHALFGRHTAIRFRYVHDFVYGFDWARWVKRDPAARSGVTPYSARFRETMVSRGQQLLAQIAADHETYSQLPAGEHRNPFGFSREPEDERRLYCDLAARDLLPVAAWLRAPRPVWRRPFAQLRDQRAVELGM